MKNSILLAALLLFFSFITRAQISEKPFSHNPSFYIGARGGYIFNNKPINNNPTWYLKDGIYAELNGGWRKRNIGIGVSIGMLNLKRDLTQLESFTINAKTLYDSFYILSPLPPPQKPTVDAGTLETKSLTVNKSAFDLFEYKHYKSYYFTIGPDFWLGKGKLQANIYAQAGLGFAQPGYYYRKGRGNNWNASFSSNNMSQTFSVNDYAFEDFSVSKKYFNKMTASTASNPFTEKQPLEMIFVAKAGAGIEYFVKPKISLNAGINAWYQKTPEMTGGQMFTGAGSTNAKPNQYTGLVLTRQTFQQKDLLHLAGNIGIKLWFGRTDKPVTPVVNTSTVTPPPPAVARLTPKNIKVTVKDKCTGIVLPGAKITGKADGAMIFNAYTDENGIVIFRNVDPQEIELSGIKNDVATEKASVEKNEFSKTEAIEIVLLHNDPRFTLIGNAVDEKTGNPVENVTAVISNLSSNANKTVISNNDGKFFEQLEPQSDFKIVGQAKGKFSAVKEVSTKNLDRCKDLYVRLEMPMEEVVVGKKFILKNIYYDLNKDNIRPDAALELDNVVNFLTTNPTVFIELSSHTDSRASDAYNLSLSKRRATSAVKYLVSRGIAAERLIAKGYGETMLINNCGNGVKCSEEEHQENRRTEIKILKQ